MRPKTYNLWVLIEQDADTGAWVAHCVDLDVVAWGDDPGQARDHVEEAVAMVLLDDLNSGLDPLDRGPAPADVRHRLETVRQTGRAVDIHQPDVAARNKVSRFAVILSFRIRHTEAGYVLDRDGEPPEPTYAADEAA